MPINSSLLSCILRDWESWEKWTTTKSFRTKNIIAMHPYACKMVPYCMLCTCLHFILLQARWICAISHLSSFVRHQCLRSVPAVHDAVWHSRHMPADVVKATTVVKEQAQDSSPGDLGQDEIGSSDQDQAEQFQRKPLRILHWSHSWIICAKKDAGQILCLLHSCYLEDQGQSSLSFGCTNKSKKKNAWCFSGRQLTRRDDEILFSSQNDD